jgi:hypothetical protein
MHAENELVVELGKNLETAEAIKEKRPQTKHKQTHLKVGKHVAVKLDAACHIENGDVLASLDAACWSEYTKIRRKNTNTLTQKLAEWQAAKP